MSGSKVIVSPVPYEVVHDKDEYPIEKIEIDLDDGSYRKRAVKVWSAKRGIEGLLYCYDAFRKTCADKFNFDVSDWEEHFPSMLDNEAERRWNTLWATVPAAERDVNRFKAEFDHFVTLVSGSQNPRDDLIEYITHSTECKKGRNAEVDKHVSRIVTLCLIANRLHGTTPDMTEDQITLAIFNSFPEHWQGQFRLHRGRSTNFSREEIISYFRDKKAIQDSEEDNRSKKRKDKPDKAKSGDEKSNNKKQKQNTCRHHGTHPWSECSLNPRSKNYHMNPSSPFFRNGSSPAGRTAGRGNGGRFQGRGGRGYNNDRGSGRGGNAGGSRYNNNNNSNTSNDQYYGGDRGSDRGRESTTQDQQETTPGQSKTQHQENRASW